MFRRSFVPVLLFTGALPLAGTRPAAAQVEGLDLSYGRWWHDAIATTWSLGLYRSLPGPFSYGLALTHLDDQEAAPDDRTATGGEATLAFARDGRGPYLIASAGISLLHHTTGLDAWWSAGGGWALPLFADLSLGLDLRYRWEDRGFRGFWRLDAADRNGFQLQGRVAFGLPGRASPRGPPGPGRVPPDGASHDFSPPNSEDVHTLARRGGASDIAARATASVVETALRVMGSPYTWGGTDDNGFDCSGLIQYAYREVGIILPRVSRDQLRTGTAVDSRLDALRPGDLLGFAVEGGQVSHIGLYVGDGQFIHSASGGVRLSSLTATDPDSRWWQRRWVTARRIIE